MTQNKKPNRHDTTTSKNSRQTVCCTDCLHARLIQYDSPCDPLLAECTRKPQHYSPDFPYQVEVAKAEKQCPMYQDTCEVRIPQLRPRQRCISQACYVTSKPKQAI